MSDIKIERLDAFRWIIPPVGGMRVPGLIYADERMIKAMGKDESPKQVANVAHLPGIIGHSLAMPDIHWGYGFPIGGVAAFDMEEGIISPGGVGYDINCGVRLMATNLQIGEIKDKLRELVIALFRNIPAGVGSEGACKLSVDEEKKVLRQGAAWAVGRGYGSEGDLARTEDGGAMQGADPTYVSARALERGRRQLGTLGSGNHFLEIEVVEEIFDRRVASAFGLTAEGQVAVAIHTGSRGFGYQVCDDYLARMVKRSSALDFPLPDRQLACAYLASDEGKEYMAAMACAANYAWANRQILMHRTAQTFEKTLQRSPRDIGMKLVYDVCHNIAKVEEFEIEGRKRRVCVHRKGATRALPPRHPLLPDVYREAGQPVLIPGDMGTGAYVLVGTDRALEETFGSTCHGAGRVMSRNRAMKASRNRSIAAEMADRGVIVLAAGKKTLSEEMPEAYKDIEEVVNVVHRAGLSTKVARLRAVGCIKG
ncbi:MAG: RtcB family protein [Deltaproteobacteria bacterium]|nr:RtcB family protein [Deltaproteobacteria bacterium]